LAQSVVEYVDTTLDNAVIGRIHSRVFAIVTAGLFFDVIDFIILGSLVPDMVRTHFASPAEIGTVGTAQIIGLFIGAVGQGEFTDRLGRKRIYQLSVLLYSLATIAAAHAPNPLWLAFGRLIAGIGLGRPPQPAFRMSRNIHPSEFADERPPSCSSLAVRASGPSAPSSRWASGIRSAGAEFGSSSASVGLSSFW
jgi:MFS family permease